MENKTAKEMYQLASLSAGTDDKLQKIIDNLIRYEASRGKFFAVTENKLDQSVIDGLRKLGYKLETRSSFGTYKTIIDWSDACGFYIVREI